MISMAQLSACSENHPAAMSERGPRLAAHGCRLESAHGTIANYVQVGSEPVTRTAEVPSRVTATVRIP